MSRKKVLALLTAAGMLFGNAAVFPSIAVSAAGEGTTAVTVTPNVTRTIAFTGELNEETGANEMAWANLGDNNYDPMPAIRAAAAPQLGCSADDVAVEDITVTYDYAFTTEDEGLTASDANIGLDVYGSCMNTAGETSDLSTDNVPLNDALAGTDKTVTFSSFYPAGTTIDMIWYFNIGIHGNGKLGETLTLTVKKIEASVRYEKSYNEIDIPYSELQGKEAIKLTYNAGKASECGHPAEDHGGASFSGTYCPYAGVPVYCVSSNGSHGSDGSDGGVDVEYWFSTGEDKPVITAVVLLKEIYAKTGTPKAGETLTFYGGVMGEPVSYELIENYVPEDIILNTGSVTSGTIQEGSDWDTATNSPVPTGKPDLNIGVISLCDGTGAKRFEGYKALQIDYTAANISHLAGISVVFQGWEADGVGGWVQSYYAASGSGTITIDLTPYQSKSYNSIFVYAVAPRTAYIGQEFAPGFTVTSAKLLTEYNGSFSSTIPEIKPVNNISIPYSELQGKEAIKLTYNAEKATECGHTTEHGAGYSGTYCPYAGVSVYCVSSDGSQSGEEYWLCASEDKAVITTVVLLKDIYAKTGTPSAGDTLEFYGNQTGEPVSYELIEKFVLEDIVFKTGSVASGTIKEHMDWSPDGDIPTGKPNLNIGEISLCEGSGKKTFEGYKALQIDYTAADTSRLAGISVAFQGWEADGIGWVQPYYAANSSGTITIDLTPYQSKSYNNIYVYAVAPATAKIGDKFAPGFTVTSAKLLTAYNGSFTATIPEIKPVEEQPITPPPSIPSTPSAPSSSSSGSQNTSVTVTEKAVEEINKASEGTTVNISLKGSTIADKDIFIAIAGKDIDIKVTISGGVTVEINGKDVENAKNVDLGVKMNSNAIKEERVNEIAKDKDTTQFSLKHNGDFGFKATFNLPVNKRYNGKYANIYWDNKGSLEFVGSSIVKNSSISYCTGHASDYVIVFDDYAYGEDISSAAGIYADAEHNENVSYGFFAAFALMIGISAVTIKKFIVKSK